MSWEVVCALRRRAAQKTEKPDAIQVAAGRASGHPFPDNEQQGKVKDQGGGRNPLAQTRRPLQPMQLFKPCTLTVRI